MSALSDTEQMDGLKSFAKKYGSAMFSGVLIALIAYFGWNYWYKKNLIESQNNTVKVQQLIDDAAVVQGQSTAIANLTLSADKILKEAPDSVQAIQTQLLMAKLAYEQQDYAAAEKALQKVASSKVDDQGLVYIVKLRLAYSQLAQQKYEDALKTLNTMADPAFKATVEEAKGDVYVAKNDIASAKKAYQTAWNELLERQEERQILQIKLESVGILVDDPEIERPVLETQMDTSA